MPLLRILIHPDWYRISDSSNNLFIDFWRGSLIRFGIGMRCFAGELPWERLSSLISFGTCCCWCTGTGGTAGFRMDVVLRVRVLLLVVVGKASIFIDMPQVLKAAAGAFTGEGGSTTGECWSKKPWSRFINHIGDHDASFDYLLVWLIVLVKCLLFVAVDFMRCLATSHRPEIILYRW